MRLPQFVSPFDKQSFNTAVTLQHLSLENASHVAPAVISPPRGPAPTWLQLFVEAVWTCRRHVMEHCRVHLCQTRGRSCLKAWEGSARAERQQIGGVKALPPKGNQSQKHDKSAVSCQLVCVLYRNPTLPLRFCWGNSHTTSCFGNRDTSNPHLWEAARWYVLL